MHISALPPDIGNSVAFRPTKDGHEPSELPQDSLKIDGTDPPPLV